MRENYFNDLDNYLDHVKRRQRQWQWILNIITFFVVGYATYAFLNFPALQLRAVYAFNKPTVNNIVSANQSSTSSSASQTSSVSETTSSSSPSDQNNQNDQNKNDTPSIAIATHNYSSVDNLPDDVPKDGIYIEKISVKAPITWSGNADNIDELLSKGVVQIASSANAGMPGNMFLTGHSSNYWWKKGDYNTVFALLDKLDNGDKIVIRSGGNNFLYKVYNKEVVEKDKVQDFITTDKDQSVTIMTCSPVGTDWRRLMVQAERV